MRTAFYKGVLLGTLLLRVTLQGLVYVMAGSGCCFCPYGGSSRAYVSSTGPLGQYTYIGDANPASACNDTTLPVSLSASRADACTNLSGPWLAFDTPGCPSPSSVVVSITMEATGRAAGPLPFSATDPQWDAPGNGTLNGADVAFTGHWGGGTTLVQGILRAASATAPPCSEIAWTSPGHTQERWCRDCALGGGLAVSAQQFQVFAIPVQGSPSPALLYFGERWGSAPTGLKSDDFQVTGGLRCVRPGACRPPRAPRTAGVAAPRVLGRRVDRPHGRHRALLHAGPPGPAAGTPLTDAAQRCRE